MEARFEEFFARDDERRLVEANHHQEVIEAQKAMRSSWNLRLAIIGVVLSLVLAILAWFTYQEAKTRMGSFLAPHRPGRSALTAPGFEASINPKEMP